MSKLTNFGVKRDARFNNIRTTTRQKAPCVNSLIRVKGGEGDIILNPDDEKFYGHTGVQWEQLNPTPTPPVIGKGMALIIANDNSMQAATFTFAGFPVDATPAAGAYSWINFNDLGWARAITVGPEPVAPVYRLFAIPLNTPEGWHIETSTPNDEHFIIDVAGVWMISFFQRVSTSGFVSIDVDFGLGMTLPGTGPGPTPPTTDGLASTGTFGTLVASSASGTGNIRLPAGTRIDVYVKAEAISATTTTLILEQNGYVAAVRTSD